MTLRRHQSKTTSAGGVVAASHTVVPIELEFAVELIAAAIV
jgi:hypothetical protein